MNKFKNIKGTQFAYLLILQALFLLINKHNVQAQNADQVELLNANTLSYDEQQGGKIRKLIGEVIFKQNNAILYCDSAYQYTELNIIDAYSNVHIKQGDTLDLYGQFLHYSGNDRKARLEKKVRMKDPKMTLTTEFLDYDLNKSEASYSTGGKIVDQTNTLVSKKGIYYSSQKKFFFRKDVVLNNPDYRMICDSLIYNTQNKTAYFTGPTNIFGKEEKIYCENGWYDTEHDISQFSKHAILTKQEQILTSDSMYYDAKQGKGRAFMHVTLKDTVQKILIQGNYAEFVKPPGRKKDEHIGEKLFVTQEAMLTKAFEKDSLFLHADTLFSNFDSTGLHRVLYAYHHVKMFKPDMRGKCDSLAYHFSDSSIRMFNAPVIWTDKNQLTGDLIKIQLAHQKIDKMFLFNSSFVISLEDTGRYNQVKGKNMTAYFKDTEMYKMYVEGNGQTIYYARNDKKELMGVNRADCSHILLLVKENKVQKITLIKSPEATFYPIDELPLSDLFLKGFNWQYEDQPQSKADIFIWKMQP